MRVDLEDDAGQVCQEVPGHLEATRLEEVPGHAEDALGQMALCLVLPFLIISPHPAPDRMEEMVSGSANCLIKYNC